MRRADLISCLILVAGLVAMFAAWRFAGPLEVTRQSCVEFWNTSPYTGDEPGDDVELRIFAEGEQDLGYGLCRVEWTTPEGACQSFSTPVWKDTTTWDRNRNRQPLRCQTSPGGGGVTLLADGRLRLEG